MEKIFDCLIIGAGPAGVNAAIYLKRSGISNFLMFDNDSSSLEISDYKIDNFYSYESISSKELKQLGLKQVKSLDIEVKNEEVVHLSYDYESNLVKVKTNKEEYSCKFLVLATGKKRKTLNIKGLKDLEGKGVSYCATCDGFFYRNKDVVVIGTGEFANSEASYLKGFVKSCKLLNGDNIEEISRLDNKINIKLKDNSSIETDGVFVALGTASSSTFIKQLGLDSDINNCILINEDCQTNYQNIFACGDNTPGVMQISKALYQGMITGIKISKLLKEK